MVDFEEDKTFKSLGLCDPLAEACENLGWKAPSKIQEKVIPRALKGRDLFVLAQIGSGKTGAYALPILQALLEKPQAFIACVLLPTRELALQIAEDFKALGSSINAKYVVLGGGATFEREQQAIKKRPHIVVGTPGRLLNHLFRTKCFKLCSLKFLVLDEADKFSSMYLVKNIDLILRVIPQERKTYLFSGAKTKKVRELQRACLKCPVKLDTFVGTLKQHMILMPAEYKDSYLVQILSEKPGTTSMVFVHTCKETRLLSQILQRFGLNAIPMNGQMTLGKRLDALNKIKDGECNILICTDVASKLDIPSVNMVINYNIPEKSRDYFDRVGRSTRPGHYGVAISLVNQGDEELIERLIGKKLPVFRCNRDEACVKLIDVKQAKEKALAFGEIKLERLYKDHSDHLALEIFKRRRVRSVNKNTRPSFLRFKIWQQDKLWCGICIATENRSCSWSFISGNVGK